MVNYTEVTHERGRRRGFVMSVRNSSRETTRSLSLSRSLNIRCNSYLSSQYLACEKHFEFENSNTCNIIIENKSLIILTDIYSFRSTLIFCLEFMYFVLNANLDVIKNMSCIVFLSLWKVNFKNRNKMCVLSRKRFTRGFKGC